MARRGQCWPAAVAAAVVLAGASPARAQKAVFLVRHAEKVDQSRDAVLSDAGHERAKLLARQLGAAGIKAIYVTEFQRTAQTAAVLAKDARLTPIVVPAEKERELVDAIRKKHAGDAVLIVGHTNTVPALLRRLGHLDAVTIPDSEYDNLFVVIPGTGPPTVLRLRY